MEILYASINNDIQWLTDGEDHKGKYWEVLQMWRYKIVVFKQNLELELYHQTEDLLDSFAKLYHFQHRYSSLFFTTTMKSYFIMYKLF